jgi:lysophospholipase L1-like esterase
LRRDGPKLFEVLGEAGVSPRRHSPIAGRAVRLLFSLALFLGLGEAAARLTGFVDRVNPMPRRLYMATDVSDLPYRLRPGVEVDVTGSHISVNELGMRDRPGVSQRPTPGVRRILVLGDSVAFGWLQQVEHAFPSLLESELRGAGGAWTSVEVLNAGVPGYNAVTESAWFRQFGEALQPEVVVVLVNLNDYDATPHLNGLGVLSYDDDRVSRWSPSNWSELWLAARWSVLLLRGDPLTKAAAATATATPTPAASPEGATRPGWDRVGLWVSRLRKRFYHAPTEPQWGHLDRAWSDLAARGRSIGARVVFAIVPDGDQVDVPDPDFAPQERLLGLCRARGFECVDLTPAFLAAPAGTILHTDIMHPNDAGHAIAAHAIAAHLRGDARAAATGTDGAPSPGAPSAVLHGAATAAPP